MRGWVGSEVSGLRGGWNAYEYVEMVKFNTCYGGEVNERVMVVKKLGVGNRETRNMKPTNQPTKQT